MIRFTRVTKTYPRTGTAVNDVSLLVNKGEFVLLTGASGAGKTSLLKMTYLEERPTSGEVRYDGESIAGLAAEPLARRRAVLSQHVELAFALPVTDVVLMGRYPHYGRVPAPRDLEIVNRALALVGMEDKRDQPYPTLSGGEQQKVHLARVLAQIWSDDPAGGSDAMRYLFLDEPTSGLDVHYQLHVLKVVRELLSPGCTVIAVLHDLNMAFEYGDHFVLLERGTVAVSTSDSRAIPAEVLERVFRVRARPLQTREGSGSLWRFEL